MPSRLNLRARLRRMLSLAHRSLRPDTRTVHIIGPLSEEDRPVGLEELESLLMRQEFTAFVRSAANGRYAPLFTPEVDASLTEIMRTRQLRPTHCRNPRFLGVCVALLIAWRSFEYDAAVEKIRTLMANLADEELAGKTRVGGWRGVYHHLITTQDTEHDWRILDVPVHVNAAGAVGGNQAAEDPIDWETASEQEVVDWMIASNAATDGGSEVDWMTDSHAATDGSSEVDWMSDSNAANDGSRT
jgi:hypothetical protein